jgi:hypothetical protein
MPGDPRGWRHDEPSAIVVGWGGYAEYRVALEPEPNVDAKVGPIPILEASVGFLLSVLPLALPLFDIEPLHGSSVAVNGSALLLLGPQGTGKSSVAAALEPLGFGLLTDDTCAIDRQGRLWPGPPIINPRWGDAQQPVIGTYNRKSLRAPLAHSSAPRPVAAVLTLTPGPVSRPTIRALSTTDAFRHILGNARAPDVLPARRQLLQLNVGAMLSPLPCAIVRYDPEIHGFDHVADAVVGWVSRLG